MQVTKYEKTQIVNWVKPIMKPTKIGLLVMILLFSSFVLKNTSKEEQSVIYMPTDTVTLIARDTLFVKQIDTLYVEKITTKVVKEKLTTKTPIKKSIGKPSDFAPISVINAPKSVEAYIKRFVKVAQEEHKKYGVPASISLAQGLVESRYGTSKLAVQNNNHFGVKCFSKKCKRGHCTNHFDDSHKDYFIRYNSAWESWRAHSKMLSNGRYKKLKKYGKDYKKWAYGLQSLGYATDNEYAEKLIGTIKKYKLYKYD